MALRSLYCASGFGRRLQTFESLVQDIEKPALNKQIRSFGVSPFLLLSFFCLLFFFFFVGTGGGAS